MSAPKNLLASLKVAWELNRSGQKNKNSFTPRYEPFSDYELVEMVTANPARSLKWDHRVGQLREGLIADILVIDRVGDEKDLNPYKALIRATEKNVQLVLVGGEALYGEEAIMTELKPGDFELIGDGTFTKAIDVTRSGPTKGSQTMAEIQTALSTAMAFEIPAMFSSFPAVSTIEFLLGRPIVIQEFAFFFGLIFPDYLPTGAAFPPGAAEVGFLLFGPGPLSLPLTPIYTSADPTFFEFMNEAQNAMLPDIQSYYAQ